VVAGWKWFRSEAWASPFRSFERLVVADFLSDHGSDEKQQDADDEDVGWCQVVIYRHAVVRPDRLF